jgi:hypothetical protein
MIAFLFPCPACFFAGLGCGFLAGVWVALSKQKTVRPGVTRRVNA